ncbi:hypothetical protein AD998_09400 [bacterium 336/3]|nr:hypothetical protein AD998_09400 [bacterium 336/3]
MQHTKENIQIVVFLLHFYIFEITFFHYSFMYSKERFIPLGLKIRVLFGDVSSIVGFSIMALGLIFVIVFVGFADFSDWKFKPDSPKTQGIITTIGATNSKENKNRIYAYYYEFSDNKDTKQTGVSYGYSGQYQVGDTPTIIYLTEKPTYSRIENLRKEPFGMFVVFTAIFPCIGLGFAVFGVLTGLKNLKILKYGMIGYGKYIRSEATNTKINGRRVMRLYFEMMVGDKSYTVTASSHQPEHLLDEAQEMLFYLPQEPTKAVLKDALPGRPKILSDGSLEDYSLFPSALFLLLPLTVLIELLIFYKMMTS